MITVKRILIKSRMEIWMKKTHTKMLNSIKNAETPQWGKDKLHQMIQKQIVFLRQNQFEKFHLYKILKKWDSDHK